MLGLRHLVLDFDGVISDSMWECFLSAHNAYVEWSGTGQKHFVAAEYRASTSGARLKELRPLAKAGDDYVFLVHAERTGHRLRNQDDYDQFKAENEALKKKFWDLFYVERETLMKSHRAEWLSLSPLYPGIAELLRSAWSSRTFVVTTKVVSFVEEILSSNEVPLPKDRLIHAKNTDEKAAALRDIVRRVGSTSPSELLYVDDNVHMVLSVRAANVPCVLATWGYCSEEHLELARAEGVRTADLTPLLGELRAQTPA